MKTPREDIKKITVNLPASLIDPLLEDGELSLTETIKEALEGYKRRKLFDKLEAMRGSVDFGVTWQELKEDRE